MKNGKTLLEKNIAIFIILILSYACISFAQEQITITTYYPAPFGIYRELRTDGMTVGSPYRSAAVGDGNLFASGYVGIGTTTPPYRLTVGTQTNPFGVTDAGDIVVTGGSDGRWQFYKPAGSQKISIEDTGFIIFWDRVGIGTSAPYSNLEISGTATVNTCVQRRYNATSGNTSCPPGTYITLPTITTALTPAVPGYFTCCKTCPNTDTNNNGMCDD